MTTQQLELIYSQSSLLYEFFPYAPWSILDKARHNSGPHIYGIVGSEQENHTDQFLNQLQQLSIQQTMTIQNCSSVAPPTHMLDVHSVHSTNPKANQHLDGKKN
jgi:hypothetical protein